MARLKNITFSADESLIENARLAAQENNTTLNEAFRDWLTGYQARKAELAAYMDLKKTLANFSIIKKPSRDELNER